MTNADGTTPSMPPPPPWPATRGAPGGGVWRRVRRWPPVAQVAAGVLPLVAAAVVLAAVLSATGFAPEGGRRSGDGRDLTSDGSAAGADEVDRAAAANELLAILATLTVEPEHGRAGYERDLFDHWDDDDGDGCDTRCEVLSSQRRPDGSWLSEWDGYTTDDPGELQVDHVVALAEAWDSGADRWSAAQRDDFADHLPNLLAVSAAANLRKSDRDAAEWFPSRSAANCLWASTVVRVKAHWDLSVDAAEGDALGNLLRTCAGEVP